MLLTCPICHEECTVDGLSVDSVTCPTCGQQLSTRVGASHAKAPSAETPKPNDETGAWCGDLVVSSPDFDIFPLRLGRYCIETLIAQGGFAKVYLAMDEELGRQVALKIPRPEKFQSPEKLGQFLTEARIAARLRHPGIVTIFDVGQFANGTNYIAMEYVPGRSLADLIVAGRVPVPRAVDLLAKVAEAVHEAHRAGLVHRDLKPANILIDERGEPRVVDFGLAVHETVQGRLRGEVAGTPAYMSPEQFRGEAHQLDGRTDIWSLGCVLYQLLTGRRPFNGDINQLHDEVLNKAPKPPRQIDDGIPRELESICFKCLTKSVNERYSTARDLADDLRNWSVSDSSVRQLETVREKPQPTPVAAPRKWIGGQRTALYLVLLAIGGLSLLAVNPPFKSSREPEQKQADAVPQAAAAVESKAPDKNRLLDSRVQPSVWLPLLDRKPEPMIWPGDPHTEHWSYDADRQEVSMDVLSQLFVELGQTNAEKYQLQMAISKNVLSGETGLCWGFTPDEPKKARSSAKFQIVCFYCNLNGDPACVQIRREMCSLIWETGRQRPTINRATIARSDVPLPRRNESRLEVDIQHGLVMSVRWNEQQLSNLSDDNPVARKIAVSLPGGKIGLYGANGASRFSDARFRLVD